MSSLHVLQQTASNLKYERRRNVNNLFAHKASTGDAEWLLSTLVKKQNYGKSHSRAEKETKKEMQIDRRRWRRRQVEAGVCLNGRQPRRVPWGRGMKDLIGRDGGWFLLLIRGIIKYFDGCALSLRDSVESVTFHCS